MPDTIPASTLEKFTTFGDLPRYLRRRAGGLLRTELSIAVAVQHLADQPAGTKPSPTRYSHDPGSALSNPCGWKMNRRQLPACWSWQRLSAAKTPQPWVCVLTRAWIISMKPMRNYSLVGRH